MIFGFRYFGFDTLRYNDVKIFTLSERHALFEIIIANLQCSVMSNWLCRYLCLTVYISLNEKCLLLFIFNNIINDLIYF